MLLSRKTWATAAAVVVALGGARLVLAQTGGSAPAKPSGSAHANAGYRAHTPAALTQRFPEAGVTITPAGSSARSQAASSPLTSGAAALTALQRDRVHPFGPSIGTYSPTESLQTVTERFPVTRGVTARRPYQAWVVEARGPVLDIGGSAIGKPAPNYRGVLCTDVAIYDFRIAGWSEFFQDC